MYAWRVRVARARARAGVGAFGYSETSAAKIKIWKTKRCTACVVLEENVCLGSNGYTEKYRKDSYAEPFQRTIDNCIWVFTKLKTVLGLGGVFERIFYDPLLFYDLYLRRVWDICKYGKKARQE